MASQPEQSKESPSASGALGEISQGPGAFERFLDQHHMKILVVGLLAALGVAGYVVKQGIDQGRETSGGHALQQAKDEASLQAVLESHASSRAAGSAAVLLAESQWESGQQDAAIETLRAFVATGAGHPAKPTALASLGSKLAAQGKSGEAAEVFRTLANDRGEGSHLAAFALIGLGDLAQQDGNIEEAKAHYARVRDEFSTSPFSDAAVRRLLFVEAEMPVVVDAPAPVAEEPEEPAGGAEPTVSPSAGASGEAAVEDDQSEADDQSGGTQAAE